MASSQFSTRKPKSPARERRVFTLAEANRSLPLVSRIVRDIVNTHQRATDLQAKLEVIGNIKETISLQSELEAAVDRLQDYVDELTDLGCELKDYQTGLTDFPGRHQGRDVLLCWKLGEATIQFWHEVESGFAGRQPISTLKESK